MDEALGKAVRDIRRTQPNIKKFSEIIAELFSDDDLGSLTKKLSVLLEDRKLKKLKDSMKEELVFVNNMSEAKKALKEVNYPALKDGACKESLSCQ